MLEEMKVSDLIKMIHQFHESEILKVKKENDELKLYKELVDKSITDQELKREYVALKHRLADAEKELKCWRTHGTPF